MVVLDPTTLSTGSLSINSYYSTVVRMSPRGPLCTIRTVSTIQKIAMLRFEIQKRDNPPSNQQPATSNNTTNNHQPSYSTIPGTGTVQQTDLGLYSIYTNLNKGLKCCTVVRRLYSNSPTIQNLKQKKTLCNPSGAPSVPEEEDCQPLGKTLHVVSPKGKLSNCFSLL